MAEEQKKPAKKKKKKEPNPQTEAEKKRISLAMYGVVVNIKDTLSFPTHDTLAYTLRYAAILFAVSLLSGLLDFYTFISWQGCLVCIIVLLVLLWVERAENDTLVKAYKQGQVYLNKAKKIAQGRQAGEATPQRKQPPKRQPTQKKQPAKKQKKGGTKK